MDRGLDQSTGQAGREKISLSMGIELEENSQIVLRNHFKNVKIVLRNGHVAVVDTLLTAGVPVDATDHKGLTPLMMACMFGRSMMSAYLLGKVST